MGNRIINVMDVGVISPNIVDVVVESEEDVEKMLKEVVDECEAAFTSKDRAVIILKSGVIILVRKPKAIQAIR